MDVAGEQLDGPDGAGDELADGRESRPRVARVYAECAERDCAAIIPLRKGQPERKLRIPRSTDEWRSLYRRRSAVEREFGNLKHNFGLAFLRVRGIERVRLHADLCILARRALALERARGVSLAA